MTLRLACSHTLVRLAAYGLFVQVFPLAVLGLRYGDAILVGVLAEILCGYRTSFCVGCRNLCTLRLKPQ